MEIIGKVIQVLPLQQGVSARTGNPWSIKTFILERIANKCVAKLTLIEPSINWNAKRDVIIDFIRTKKKEYYDKLEIGGLENEFLLDNWVTYYKDYYWKKWYKNPEEREWDRILVSTMFTFYLWKKVD